MYLKNNDTNKTQILKPKLFAYHVPMGSPHVYRAYAEYLRGRPAEDQADLDNMNLRIRIDIILAFTTGYDQSFGQACTPEPGVNFFSQLTNKTVIKGGQGFVCVPTTSTSQVNTSLISKLH